MGKFFIIVFTINKQELIHILDMNKILYINFNFQHKIT